MRAGQLDASADGYRWPACRWRAPTSATARSDSRREPWPGDGENSGFFCQPRPSEPEGCGLLRGRPRAAPAPASLARTRPSRRARLSARNRRNPSRGTPPLALEARGLAMKSADVDVRQPDRTRKKCGGPGSLGQGQHKKPERPRFLRRAIRLQHAEVRVPGEDVRPKSRERRVPSVEVGAIRAEPRVRSARPPKSAVKERGRPRGLHGRPRFRARPAARRRR